MKRSEYCDTPRCGCIVSQVTSDTFPKDPVTTLGPNLLWTMGLKSMLLLASVLPLIALLTSLLVEILLGWIDRGKLIAAYSSL